MTPLTYDETIAAILHRLTLAMQEANPPRLHRYRDGAIRLLTPNWIHCPLSWLANTDEHLMGIYFTEDLLSQAIRQYAFPGYDDAALVDLVAAADGMPEALTLRQQLCAALGVRDA